MPGVPSGRGCNACRKQKKKCDQARPACSRCARLKIDCVGAGEQRYKFHNTTVSPSRFPKALPSSSSSSSSSLVPANAPPNIEAALYVVVPTLSSYGSQRTAGQLAKALEIKDPRFDLSVFGRFMSDIPRRLGQNPALDSAVEAMTTLLPLVQPGTEATSVMLHKYGLALQSLRLCLSDKKALESPDTLCALYLVVVCQGWLRGIEGPYPSHGEAVAQILHGMKGRLKWTEGYENDILTTLCFLVILESIINPRIKLDPDLWHSPITHGPKTPGDGLDRIESLTNHCLAYTVSLLRDPGDSPESRRDLAEAYLRLRSDQTKISTLLAQFPLVPSEQLDVHGEPRLVTPLPDAGRKIHIRLQTAYSLLTMIAMRVNVVLHHLLQQPECADDLDEALALVDLGADMVDSVDNIIRVSEASVQYLPLGASEMPLCLVCAYIATDSRDTARRWRIQHLVTKMRPELNLEEQLSTWSTVMDDYSSEVVITSICSKKHQELQRKDMCCIL